MYFTSHQQAPKVGEEEASGKGKNVKNALAARKKQENVYQERKKGINASGNFTRCMNMCLAFDIYA